MNHEMNTLTIGRQEAFSTMVSNKVPATSHCLSDVFRKLRRAGKNNRGRHKRQKTAERRGGA